MKHGQVFFNIYNLNVSNLNVTVFELRKYLNLSGFIFGS